MDIKEQIGKRITESRKALGITIKELSARIGTLSAGRISNWEQCTRMPGPVEAKLLAEQLGVSASYLLCLTDNPQGELLVSSNNATRLIPVVSFKELDQAKTLLQQLSEQALPFDGSKRSIVVDRYNKSFNHPTLFAVFIEDISMQPELNAGDLVIVDVDAAPKPGDYVVIHFPLKKQAILRKYSEADGYLFQLLANNKLWATINVKTTDDVMVCGVVVEHRRFF